MVIEGFVINGGYIAADALETRNFVVDLYEFNTFNFEQLTEWLQANVQFKKNEPAIMQMKISSSLSKRYWANSAYRA